MNHSRQQIRGGRHARLEERRRRRAEQQDPPKEEPRPPALCHYCDEAILEGEPVMPIGLFGSDEKIFMHKECLLRLVLGSVGHQQKTCSCFGGQEEDPPGLTKREAAKAAVALYEKREHHA